MNYNKIVQSFSTARTEFQSETNSVYDGFVVPPYIDEIDLAKIEHSVSIEGGRGCGKTTYVRYFSHWTQFDKRRESIQENALDCIILYWKPDTAYCRSMSEEWLSTQNARLFFKSLAALMLLDDLMSALENISHHVPLLKEELVRNDLFWERVDKVIGGKKRGIEENKYFLDDLIFDIQVSINANSTDSVLKIDPKSMFEYLLPALQENSSVFKSTVFKIFIDEFENLEEYQQKIVNSYRKHSNKYISWNVAHKRYAQLSNETDGPEKLQQQNDYRNYTLDESFSGDEDKQIFLCELLLLRLLSSGMTCEIENLDRKILGDRNKISLRSSNRYKSNILKVVKHILPNRSHKELAEIALTQKAVRNNVKSALSDYSDLKENEIESLINNCPDIAIASFVIVKQKSFKKEDLREYITQGCPPGTDTKYGQRVKTFLFTSLLHLNARYEYIQIPVYSGFDRFYQLSTTNIRHFFELCYNTFRHSSRVHEEVSNKIESFPPCSLEDMHLGAIDASNNIVKEIPTYSPLGLTLNSLVNRLGHIFRIWQEAGVQSEPEKTHFFVKNDFGSFPKDIGDVVRQAMCWRVLIESKATKDKSSQLSSGYEYQINPIYAPSFSISFRKIRRLEFSESEFRILCNGGNEEYQLLRNKQRELALSKSELFEGPQGRFEI